MTPAHPGESERRILLGLARQALTCAVLKEPLPVLDLAEVPAALSEPGASFITLTVGGDLRGCVGTLEAAQSLVESVLTNVVAAAFSDPRFPPVQPQELEVIAIEVACLSPLEALTYQDPDELVARIRPGVHGVLLRDGLRRATFLPKVWEKIPDPAQFLSHLCEKMGAEPELWRLRSLEVFVYTAETIAE